MRPPDTVDTADSADPSARRADAAGRAVLGRLAGNLAAVGARDRLTLELPPFRAFLSPGAADDMMSFAMPVAGDADWGAGIAPLCAAFAERQRAVRVEHFAELQPGLAEALDRAGLDRLSTQQAMALRPRWLKRRRLPATCRVRYLDPDRPSLICSLMRLQQIAFDLPESTHEDEDWRDFLDRAVADGAMLGAMAMVDGVAVACAGLQIGGGAAELTGVATRPGWRRRGLASALCAEALAGYFAQGYDLAWLSAADTVAGAVYRRIGFRKVGTLVTHGARRDDAGETRPRARDGC
jgi:ribosomal protein S18 acetylase RimI-like enzyme